MQENQKLQIDASFTIPFERSNKKRARAIPGSLLKRAVNDRSAAWRESVLVGAGDFTAVAGRQGLIHADEHSRRQRVAAVHIARQPDRVTV